VLEIGGTSAEGESVVGARIKAPKVPREVSVGVCPLPTREVVWEGLCPLPRKIFNF